MGFLDFGKKGGNMAAPAPAGSGTNVPVSQVLSMKSQGLNNNQIANQLRVSGYSLTQIRDAMAQADIKSAVVPGFGDNGVPGGVMPQGPGPMPDFGGSNMEMPNMGGMPDFGESNMEMPNMGGMPDMNRGGPNQMPQGYSPQGPPSQGLEMPPLPNVPSQPPAFSQRPLAQAPMQGPPQISGAGFSMEQLVNELQRVIEEIIEERWADVDDKLNALDMWKVKIEGRVDELNNRVNESTARIDEFSKGMLKKTEEYQSTMESVGTEMEAVEKLMGRLVPSLAEEIKELRGIVDKMKKR